MFIIIFFESQIVTVLSVREDLLGKPRNACPIVTDYTVSSNSSIILIHVLQPCHMYIYIYILCGIHIAYVLSNACDSFFLCRRYKLPITHCTTLPARGPPISWDWYSSGLRVREESQV